MKNKIPNYLKYIYINILVLLFYVLIYRFLFYLFFIELDNTHFEKIKKAVNLGIRFDIKLSVIAILPLAIFVFVVNHNFFNKKLYKFVGNLYLTLTYLSITLFYFFDFGHYEYLNSRISATALRFVSNIKISTQALFESYPIYRIMVAIILITFLAYKLTSYIYVKLSKTSHNNTSKKSKTFYIITSILLFAFGIYNSFTNYPLRWSQAFFSQNNSINNFSLNPILYFFDSFKFRNESVNLDKTKRYYPAVANQLELSKEPFNFNRRVIFPDSISKKPNIVIVMLESVGVAPMSYFKNPINTTPNMDSIMKRSVVFSNFFVHKAGTAASVFASITGLPDVDAVRTASRNPMVIDQRIIFDQFKGYEKQYFIGGSANWANIRGVLQSNINDLKIFEEGSYEIEERVDVWGIDDYDLFKESDIRFAQLHKKKKPFIAYIQTASNHMPFTVPVQKESFKILKEDAFSKQELKNAGFDGIARLNALRYLDFNVAKFLQRAKKSGYYDNTIFLFFGDHNTAMSKVDNYKDEFDLGIQVNHVPFFIHAPKFVKPNVISKFSKLVDVIPTAASLSKNSYTNYTLGSNILNTSNKNNFAFIFNSVNGEPSIGLLKDDFIFTKKLVTKKSSLRKLSGDKRDIKTEFPNIVKSMDSLASGYYHATKYLYLNNKKQQ
ncbi:LTA synthase family protein [Tenacibaculum sp. nBUS_03]|uniref:LTA synthase family protein n=1 Tax=Tenacibaculum sp. nBUS_03 TaxID=3395320 RepID=UPI003EB87F93